MRLDDGDSLSRMYLLREEDGNVTADYEAAQVVINRLRIGGRDTKGVKR